MAKVKYELYFRNNLYPNNLSITSYRYNTLEEAREEQKRLNRQLINQGSKYCEYLIYQVVRTRID